jgi:hypothetical protein
VPNPEYDSYLPLGLASVAVEICKWDASKKFLPTVGGDNDILLSTEWSPENFRRFQARLAADVDRILKALKASTVADANYWWKRVFGD